MRIISPSIIAPPPAEPAMISKKEGKRVFTVGFIIKKKIEIPYLLFSYDKKISKISRDYMYHINHGKKIICVETMKFLFNIYFT